MASNNMEHKHDSAKASVDNNGNLTCVIDKWQLECCVCSEPLTGCISTCNDCPYSLCTVCINNMRQQLRCHTNIQCPMCKQTCGVHRNYILEKAVAEVMVKCSNNGCIKTVYPSNMEEHLETCHYSTIKCTWCDGETTPTQINRHTVDGCKHIFTELKSSNIIELSKLGNTHYSMNSHRGDRTLYITPKEKGFELFCIQLATVNEDDKIIITRSTIIKTVGMKSLRENSKIEIPIHTPEDLISGKLINYSISVKDLKKWGSLKITGFDDEFNVEERCVVKDNDDRWRVGTILRRKYDPDRVNVQFDVGRSSTHEWFMLDDGEQRIKPVENRRIAARPGGPNPDNLDEEAQVRMAINMSLGH
jgi:hypothetical protein